MNTGGTKWSPNNKKENKMGGLRIMSTSKKLKSEQLFVRVETVMHDLQISRPFAYRMIAGWNEELKEQGYTTICGRIPKAYYEKKIYGMTKE